MRTKPKLRIPTFGCAVCTRTFPGALLVLQRKLERVVGDSVSHDGFFRSIPERVSSGVLHGTSDTLLRTPQLFRTPREFAEAQDHPQPIQDCAEGLQRDASVGRNVIKRVAK